MGKAQNEAIYTCPMHPEVESPVPGACPKCGMSIALKSPIAKRTEWTCPMHPEVVSSAPGACPKCGMALEPRDVSGGGDEENAELIDMTRRFWWSTALSVPVVFLGMTYYAPPVISAWVQLILSTPVVLWTGWPIFIRLWNSLLRVSPNMFTLTGLGIGIAYGYSVVAVLFPGIFPAVFRTEGGLPPVYFEVAAVITALVLLGQVLELRAQLDERRADVLRGLVAVGPGSITSPSADDRQIRATILEMLDRKTWASLEAVSVIVVNGVVYLWGIAQTDSDKDAIRVAAENVAGVSKVHDFLSTLHGVLSRV